MRSEEEIRHFQIWLLSAIDAGSGQTRLSDKQAAMSLVCLAEWMLGGHSELIDERVRWAAEYPEELKAALLCRFDLTLKSTFLDRCFKK
jgi:hypothetical protein